MKKATPPTSPKPTNAPAPQDKKARLSDALRANLKRRKAPTADSKESR